MTDAGGYWYWHRDDQLPDSCLETKKIINAKSNVWQPRCDDAHARQYE